MTDQINTLWHAMTGTAVAKVINYFAIPPLIIVSAEASKPSPFINLADYGFLSIAIPSWMQIVGSLWIITLLLEKFGMFKLIKWLWEKIFNARKD